MSSTRQSPRPKNSLSRWSSPLHQLFHDSLHSPFHALHKSPHGKSSAPHTAIDAIHAVFHAYPSALSCKSADDGHHLLRRNLLIMIGIVAQADIIIASHAHHPVHHVLSAGIAINRQVIFLESFRQLRKLHAILPLPQHGKHAYALKPQIPHRLPRSESFTDQRHDRFCMKAQLATTVFRQ